MSGVRNASRYNSLMSASRLLQPERHVHLAVQLGGGAKSILRLLPLARPSVELAEAGPPGSRLLFHFDDVPPYRLLI